MNLSKRRILIFLRAFAIILLSTTGTYCIANNYKVQAILVGMGISTMWTFNVSDLSVSTWKDRIAYVLGGAAGASISLFVIAK